MVTLKVRNLGPLKEANLTFNDLTILVGPQASGKSILLQLIKLLIDKNHIRKTLEQYGFIWGKNEEDIIDKHFGGGMSGIWNEKTKVTLNKKSYSLSFLKRKESAKDIVESLFYIPSQRSVCLQNGWPLFFTDYENSVPYVLKHFSETLRLLLEEEMNKRDEPIFPLAKRLKEPLRQSFYASIFHEAKISIDKTDKKRFKLDMGNSTIPFMAWSAGQKEFMPLLLSFYWLCPPVKVSRKGNVKYVIIEEPETGLHPQAIKSVILQVIELMNRGYKVIISTHSPVLLEFAWAFKYLQANKVSYKALAELFDIRSTLPSTKDMLHNVLSNKAINTYYFKHSGGDVTVKDISTLDAGSEDMAMPNGAGCHPSAKKCLTSS